MVGILLLILKILGIVILSILGLIILILLVAVLVPFRYKITGTSDDYMELEVVVTFLLKFFKARWTFSADENTSKGTILWGLIKVFPKKKEIDYKKDFVTEDEKDSDKNNKENSEETDDEVFDGTSDDDSDETEDVLSSETVKAKKKKKTTKKKKKKLSFSEKIKQIKEVYLTEGNKNAVIYTLIQLGYILNKYLPRKAKGNVFFGTNDPATTGELLGALSVIPFMYQRGLNLYPDFESDTFYIRGKTYMKGYAQLGVLVIVLIRLIVNKDSRNLIKLIMDK